MRRLGFLTTGRGTALLTLVAVVLVLCISGGRMFSPGELNAQSRQGVKLGGVASHTEIGGRCSACHVSPWSGGSMASRCLECHTDVRRQLDAHRPLHGMLSDGLQCRSCHTEHHGPHAVLTSLAKFDHDVTEFKLTGKHQTAACASCHVNNVFHGTSKTCVSCHAEPQIHKGRFGAGCAQCHSTSTWIGAATKFDHNLAAFKLTGKHQTVACASCHVNNIFHGTPKTCASCHAEPPGHKERFSSGRFGSDCAQCHSTSMWRGALVKHTFPLDHHHKHMTMDCATCHTTANNYRTYTCYGCHAHEPAKMERKHARLNIANLEQCARCHPTGREHKRSKEDRESDKRDREMEKLQRELDRWLKQGRKERDD